LVFVLAAIYFVVDAAFWTIARPVTRLLGDHWIFERARTWIMSLRPYPTLALFIVPVIILEPAKPLAAYLTATGHFGTGLMVLGVAELLKLVLIERLFKLSRDKLMSIPAFAWGYGKFCQARSWVESLDTWRLMRLLMLTTKRAVRKYVLAKNGSGLAGVGKANGSRESAPDDRLRVPTNFMRARMVGTAQARLCPPYTPSRNFRISVSTSSGRSCCNQ
jgi:hypothetical protein